MTRTNLRLDATDGRPIAALIDETIERLSLDLRGLTILTEAATGAFASTAPLAAVAGADQVIAIARDSGYGLAAQAETATRRIARDCGVNDRLQVIASAADDRVAWCDVITNLGCVRPLGAATVSRLKPTAVISLMCEAWELRPGDVDLDACRDHDIAVLATNEHAAAMPVFRYCGVLAVEMVREAGVPLQGARVAVLGRGPFTPVIAEALTAAGAAVRADWELSRYSILDAIAGATAIVVAEYVSGDVILGDGGLVPAAAVAAVAPGIRIVQFAGRLDSESLAARAVAVWPDPPVGAHRMSRTLAHLGPRPVIELHAAGLKVGECGARARRAGLPVALAGLEAAARSELVQLLPSPGSQAHATQ